MPIDIPAGASDWVIALVVVGTLILGYLDRRGSKAEQKEQTATLTEVKDQVSNTHSTNLRDDIDAMHEEMRGFRKEHRDDISEIRDHLRSSDNRQRTFENDVRSLVKRTHPDEVL
ncbi:DUF2746 domain-containing protein [Nocardia salmonicida]|uniref:DUF2746 domain-containing protein n=1 Tax=Nocardia salmonicida TaxID=53431 RepID=UPI0033F21B53